MLLHCHDVNACYPAICTYIIYRLHSVHCKGLKHVANGPLVALESIICGPQFPLTSKNVLMNADTQAARIKKHLNIKFLHTGCDLGTQPDVKAG